ncbi:MAG: bifunctional (p)ppGpp synthetase/guanosine-3',5'-bis(diphosphate) 3'-pyrophosphohydrolase [Prevotellaceae bacterium]|nr:bifunctional (p)ppGpp synthetase/guanosine-3',5'-bis(diphosphate) 3'-pyrophosphohydrolase [Candidatus Minthosoma caballi]
METNYDIIVAEAATQVLEAMKNRVSPEEMASLTRAYRFASEAHKEQKRKSGEPYIIHPISVARIAAVEMKLDANSVCAAFLHDVVEDTPTTIEQIEEMFGSDVAFLVDVVTKKKNKVKIASKQVANYQQLLDSVHYDIRALMVKIADRLHNMRTLDSMRPDKQMKIAGETDYFYAPLANRLGLYDIKTDLENLSFRYRCPFEFSDLNRALADEMVANDGRLLKFTRKVHSLCKHHGIDAEVKVFYRKPYSIWRKMKTLNSDFKHINNKYYVRITFDETAYPLIEKDVCLKIYSILTNEFKEKPQSFNNQIDCAKENSYQSINVMLLSDAGIWEDVQICSRRTVESSKIGCLAGLDHSKVGEWIEKFKLVLKDIADESQESNFIEKIATTLYYDDVMVFTPQGRGVILPKGSTAIDFAFELHTDIGMHAKYCYINGKLCSIKTVLHRGDCVEIGTELGVHPDSSWIDNCCSYKAKRALRSIVDMSEKQLYRRCPHCKPIPGGETIGFKQDDDTIIIHRRSCPDAIRIASKHGDSIVDVDFQESKDEVYPITIAIRAIDRYHFLIDVIDTITNKLHLSIDSLNTVTKDAIVDCTVTFFVHSVREFTTVLYEVNHIQGVDEVKQVY